MSRLNRGTTFMRLRAFTAAVDEYTEIEQMIDALPEKERLEDEAYYSKMKGRLYLKRGAARAWISQFDDAVTDLTKALEYK